MVRTLHLQRLDGRATFGPRPGASAGPEGEEPGAWVDRQLELARQPDPALDRRLEELRPGVGFDARSFTREIGVRDMLRSEEGRRALRRQGRDVVADLVGARWVRAVHARAGLYEVMVDFWSNHFSVFARKGFVSLLLPAYQRDVLDRHALGRFEDLLLAVATSPAMLVYLDAWTSLAPQGIVARLPRFRDKGLNENYARELLELHTLGVDGGYSQRDVIETARVFTGWSLESRHDPSFAFHPRLHDPGPKRVLGEPVPGEGREQGVALLRRLARHPATARHIARKLAARFVCDDPPPELVERAARRFLETEGEIAALLREVLVAPELADPAHRKLKTPLRFAASALRETGGETRGDPELLRALGRLAELPFFSRTPDGFPESGSAWIDPAALLERMGLAVALAHDFLPGARLGPVVPGRRSGAAGASLAERQALALGSPEFQWA